MLKFDIPNPQDYLSPEIQALANRDKLISLQEYKELRMNSWEREAILSNIDNEALIYCVENCLKNISHRKGAHPCTTYDEALALLYTPELLKRLKGSMKSEPRPRIENLAYIGDGLSADHVNVGTNGYDLTGYPCPNCGRQHGNSCYGTRIQCECGVLLVYTMAGLPNKWIKIK